MKQIFTFIAVLFSVSSFAAAPGPKTSKISISSADRFITQVKIDGVMYNLDNTFVLDNIRSGNHSISLYKLEVGRFRKTTRAIYNSSISVTPGQLINIDVNRNGKVVVKTTTPSIFDRNDRGGRNDNRYNSHDNRNNNYGRH